MSSRSQKNKSNLQTKGKNLQATTLYKKLAQAHQHDAARFLSKHEHPHIASKFVDAFTPIQVMLTIVGQFPVHRIQLKDGTYTYTYKWYRPEALLFFLSLFIQFLLIIVMLYNSICMFTAKQYFDPRYRSPEEKNLTELYELVLLARYRHIFISAWVNLIYSFAAQTLIWWRVRYLRDYLSFWTRVAQTLYLHVGEDIWKFASLIMGGYFIFIATLVLLYVFDFSASFRGGPSLMAIMMFKFATPDILTFNDSTQYEIYVRSPQRWYLSTYQGIGAVTFLLILIWSKSFILLFVFKCKLLIKGFTLTNQRVYASTLKGKRRHGKRGNLNEHVLFKDHCALLDLLEGTDQLFSTIFELFVGFQVAGLLHDLYFLFLNLGQQDTNAQYAKSFDDQYFPRPFDYIFPVMMVFQYLFFIVFVPRIAARVGEEAMDGLEVIRRKTMIGRTSDDELLFHFSMFQSYTGLRQGCLLRCGGYFDINKACMSGIFGTFLGYFIILQQFHPTFEHVPFLSISERVVFRERVGKFLYRLEHLAYCHWTKSPDDPCPFL